MVIYRVKSYKMIFFCKNRLTKRDKRDIINKFPRKRETHIAPGRKIFSKNLKKGIDKREKI